MEPIYLNDWSEEFATNYNKNSKFTHSPKPQVQINLNFAKNNKKTGIESSADGINNNDIVA